MNNQDKFTCKIEMRKTCATITAQNWGALDYRTNLDLDALAFYWKCTPNFIEKVWVVPTGNELSRLWCDMLKDCDISEVIFL